MLRVFIKYREQYLCVNVTNQTSTGWHDDLLYVEELTTTTTRKLFNHFNILSGMSLEQLLTYFEKNNYKLIRIDDDPIPYEFW